MEINEFRLRRLDAFVDLFVQVLRLRGRAGLLDLEHVSLDGSKVEANAGTHEAMSHGRMEEEDDRGTGLRSGQTGPRLPTFLPTRAPQGPR
jgi:hypothetical protein